MATKKTAAQIQRELEKKYGVIPCPWWIDLCSFCITIDGEIAPTGTELVFKCKNSGIVCGAGIVCVNGLMKFSSCYGNDPYETRKTGRITGLTCPGNPRVDSPSEEITIWVDGKQMDYNPIIKYDGYWNKFFLSNLETI